MAWMLAPAEVQAGKLQPQADRLRTIGKGLIVLIQLETGQSPQGEGGGAAGVDLDGPVAIGHRLLQLVLGRVGLGAADVTDGVGGGQADAGGKIVDRRGQVALLLVVSCRGRGRPGCTRGRVGSPSRNRPGRRQSLPGTSRPTPAQA